MRPAFAFDFEWRITLFTVLLLPLLISLGFWQLQRAEEKAALAVAFEQKQHSSPALLSGLPTHDPDALAYLPVKLQGRYIQGRDFLLDNRMQGRKYGNEVLTVFELADGKLALVNRGWIIADPGRMSLPAVPAAPQAAELTGKIYVSPGEPYLLAEQQLGGENWPKQVQAVDIEKMSAALGVATDQLFPYPVRIDAGQPGALSVDWQIINVSPAKHRGYAVQWFSMAAALALIYLLRSSNLWQVIRGVTHDE
jgi:surfeit locus 1 family protein